MTPPTVDEVRAAFLTIKRAEKHLTEVMEAAGLPGRAGLYQTYMGGVGVHISTYPPVKVFRSHDGKLNLSTTQTMWGRFEETIRDAVVAKRMKGERR